MCIIFNVKIRYMRIVLVEGSLRKRKTYTATESCCVRPWSNIVNKLWMHGMHITAMMILGIESRNQGREGGRRMFFLPIRGARRGEGQWATATGLSRGRKHSRKQLLICEYRP